MVAMLEPIVGAECSQERLLEGVFRRLSAHSFTEEAEDDVAVLDVEALERRNGGHCLHHRL